MNISDLEQAVADFNPTDEQLKAFEKRLNKAEQRFTKEAQDRMVNSDWYKKEYTI